jgi:hypothetical protein
MYRLIGKDFIMIKRKTIRRAKKELKILKKLSMQMEYLKIGIQEAKIK